MPVSGLIKIQCDRRRVLLANALSRSVLATDRARHRTCPCGPTRIHTNVVLCLCQSKLETFEKFIHAD